MALDEILTLTAVAIFEQQIEGAGFFRDRTRPLVVGVCTDGLILAGVVHGLNRGPLITALRMNLDLIEEFGFLDYYNANLPNAKYSMEEYAAQMEERAVARKSEDPTKLN